jgi:hypothetical protein
MWEGRIGEAERNLTAVYDLQVSASRGCATRLSAMTIRLSAEEREVLEPAETHAFESPIPSQVISNGEFLPAPQGPLQKRFEMLLKQRAEAIAKKQNLSRRAFLRTASGMASALLAMNDVYGAVFQVSESEAADPEMGDEHAGKLSNQFVMDVQSICARTPASSGLIRR